MGELAKGGAMSEGEYNQVRSELRDLRRDVTTRLDKLTEALQEMVRIDGVLARQNDALTRIGRQVDDHEGRIRTLETGGAARSGADDVRWGLSSWAGNLVMVSASGLVAGLIVGLVVYSLTAGGG